MVCVVSYHRFSKIRAGQNVHTYVYNGMEYLCTYIWQTDKYDCSWKATGGLDNKGGKKVTFLTSCFRSSFLETDIDNNEQRRFIGEWAQELHQQGRHWPTMQLQRGYLPVLQSCGELWSRMVLTHCSKPKQGNKDFAPLPQPVVGLGLPSGRDGVLGEQLPAACASSHQYCQQQNHGFLSLDDRIGVKYIWISSKITR